MFASDVLGASPFSSSLLRPPTPSLGPDRRVEPEEVVTVDSHSALVADTRVNRSLDLRLLLCQPCHLGLRITLGAGKAWKETTEAAMVLLTLFQRLVVEDETNMMTSSSTMVALRPVEERSFSSEEEGGRRREEQGTEKKQRRREEKGTRKKQTSTSVSLNLSSTGAERRELEVDVLIAELTLHLLLLRVTPACSERGKP
eukprot:720099-Hanusia_phi.AAC.2